MDGLFHLHAVQVLLKLGEEIQVNDISRIGMQEVLVPVIKGLFEEVLHLVPLVELLEMDTVSLRSFPAAHIERMFLFLVRIQ